MAIKEGSIQLLNLPGKKLRRKFYLISLGKAPSTVAAKHIIKGVLKARYGNVPPVLDVANFFIDEVQSLPNSGSAA